MYSISYFHIYVKHIYISFIFRYILFSILVSYLQSSTVVVTHLHVMVVLI